MALIDTINAKATGRTVAVRVLLEHRSLDASWVLGAECSFAISQMVADGSVTLSQLPDWYEGGEELEIWAGWNGETECIFKGQVLDDGAKLEGGVWTLSAQGPMAKAEQAPGTGGLSWTATEGKTIVGDCLTAAGITDVDLSGGWATLGNEEAVVLPEGKSYASLINEIDEVERCITCDGPGGRVYRVQMNHIPAAAAAFSFVEGVDLFGDPSRKRTISGIRNRVVVEGHPDADVLRAREAPSPYVSGYVQYKMSSTLVDTDDIADETARLLMLELNRRVDSQSFDLLGNPYVIPGQTVEITAPGYGVTDPTNYFVAAVSHKVDESGYMTSVEVEGGIGDAGYSTGSPPIADFTYVIKYENTTDGPYYVLRCQSAVRDFDDAPDALTLAWANSANADVGSAPVYVTLLTGSDVAAGVTVTLTVTDPQANTDAIAKTIDSGSSFIVRDLYHAFYLRAEATNDGGLTWNTWTPGGGVYVHTAVQNPPQGAGLFGLGDGRLVKTTDFLATAPTLVHTFDHQILCGHVRPGNEDEMLIGTGDPASGSGESGVWRTTDGGSTWTCVKRAAHEFRDVHWGADGTMRAVGGQYEYISHDQGATWTRWPAATKTTWRWSGSADGNYWGGEADPGHVVVAAEGPTAQPEVPGIPDEVTDIRAVCHGITNTDLYFISSDGRAFTSTSLLGVRQAAVEGTQAPGCTNVRWVMFDDLLDGEGYLCDDSAGLLTTPDSFGQWLTLRQGNLAGNLQSRMISYGAHPYVEEPATGKRVIVSGADGTAPMVSFCSNVFTMLPTWTAVSGGLPASGTAYDVALDPANKDIAYVRIGGATSALSESGGLYKNAAWQSGGGWTEVLSIAAVRDAVNDVIADAEIDNLGLEAFAVGSGHLYALAACYSVGAFDLHGWRRSFWVFHSTDGGASWSAVMAADLNTSTSELNATPPRFGLALDPLDATRVYLLVSNTYGAGTLTAYRSTDAGASWSEIGSQTNSATTGGAIAEICLPQVSIGSGTGGLFWRYHVSNASAGRFQRFSGTSLVDVGSLNPNPSASPPAYRVPYDASHYVVAKLNSGTGDDDLWTTTNGGSTWALLAAGTRRPYATATWQPTASDAPRFYGAGSNASGNGVAVWTTEDLVTLTSRGSASWGTGLELRGLAIDSRS